MQGYSDYSLNFVDLFHLQMCTECGYSRICEYEHPDLILCILMEVANVLVNCKSDQMYHICYFY